MVKSGAASDSDDSADNAPRPPVLRRRLSGPSAPKGHRGAARGKRSGAPGNAETALRGRQDRCRRAVRGASPATKSRPFPLRRPFRTEGSWRLAFRKRHQRNPRPDPSASVRSASPWFTEAPSRLRSAAPWPSTSRLPIASGRKGMNVRTMWQPSSVQCHCPHTEVWPAWLSTCRRRPRGRVSPEQGPFGVGAYVSWEDQTWEHVQGCLGHAGSV
jgi:hypothetical protein